MANTERWKPISGFEGLYDVSSFGRIRSYKNSRWGIRAEPKVIEGQRGKDYKTVVLCDESGKHTHYVHRLVSEAFVPKQDGKPQVNHINGDKLDNRAENLEWCTQKENVHHAELTGLTVNNKRSVVCVELDITFKSVVEASKHTGISRTAITNCLNGWSKTAGKLHFYYKGEN